MADPITKINSSRAMELAELNRQFIEDEGHLSTLSIAQLARRMEEWLMSNYSCYGILKENRVAAYCLFRDEGEYYYIRQLFTARPFRKMGLATRLLNYLESDILKGKPVRLEVLAGNDRAHQFYLSRDYKLYCYTLEKVLDE